MQFRSLFLSLAALFIVCTFTACVAVETNKNTVNPRKIITVNPTASLYPFLQEIEETESFFSAVAPKNENRLSAIFTEPAGYKIKFNYQERTIGDYELYKFKNGLYPFTLYKNKDDKEILNGALAVVNMDEAIALATFGESKDTRLFNPEMIEKAKSGVLSHGTIAFDETTVMLYWMGNRQKRSIGKDRTLEVDFSETVGISQLKINQRTYKDFVATVNTDTINETPQKISHKLEITLSNGKLYRGYIRTEKTNAFTTFISLNCNIPVTLFDAADKGTISNFKVYTPGDVPEELVEIIFGAVK
jgi:hypothetical protein